MYTYKTHVTYEGKRKGRLTSGNGLTLLFSAPPEFGGFDGFATPEDVFVASATMCLMLTFESICKKMNIGFDFFECDGEGLLENKKGKEVFTRVVLKPKVMGDERQKIVKALKLAKKYCLVTNSINCDVILEIDDTE